MLLAVILAALIPSADGLTVHDTTLHVTWAANANLPATMRFGIAAITPGGSMDYSTAVQWLAALNASHYLGHSDWQLPATPVVDPTCNAVGPNGNAFGAGCSNSALGSLFYLSLGLQFPNTAVSIPTITTGPFANFQPYLYWTNDSAGGNGFHTVSLNTGWHGANVDHHYMYALPMIKGKVSPEPNGTVYDPQSDVTWLADANLAKTQQFGAQCMNHDGTLCIDVDGSMSHTTAAAWIAAMNAARYLGQSNWQLPPQPATDSTCRPANSGFGCTGDPLGNLYYNQLKLAQGTPVVATPSVKTGPFSNVQPYLYWSCQAVEDSNVYCSSEVPAPNFEFSFSFGNGFQGTDLQINDLYVMVYFPDPPERHRVAKH